MTVHFTKLTTPGWRWRDERRTAEWADAYASATVDGHAVSVSPRRGWRCACPDPECGHVDAVAALIHPDLLARLEGKRRTPKKEKTA